MIFWNLRGSQLFVVTVHIKCKVAFRVKTKSLGNWFLQNRLNLHDLVREKMGTEKMFHVTKKKFYINCEFYNQLVVQYVVYYGCVPYIVIMYYNLKLN